MRKQKITNNKILYEINANNNTSNELFVNIVNICRCNCCCDLFKLYIERKRTVEKNNWWMDKSRQEDTQTNLEHQQTLIVLSFFIVTTLLAK